MGEVSITKAKAFERCFECSACKQRVQGSSVSYMSWRCVASCVRFIGRYYLHCYGLPLEGMQHTTTVVCGERPG